MKKLTVQDLIDIQQAETHLQEPMAIARATGKTFDEVLQMFADEYLPLKTKVLEENGLLLHERR